MTNLSLSSASPSNVRVAPAMSPFLQQFSPRTAPNIDVKKTRTEVLSASKSSGLTFGSILRGCKACGGKGAIECPGCKGTGKNKKNGNIFERWKCFNCQGFGLISCPKCGRGGLTPEQRGER